MASSVLRSRFRFFGLPRIFLPGFPCIRSRFRYSASPYVSFRPSLIRSHDRSSGAHFQLSLSMFSASLPLPFVRFCSASGYSALCFFLSALCPIRLTVGSSSRLGSFRPLRSSPSSTAGFPSAFFRFRILSSLFVSFRPSLLRFPQLFRRCSPVALTQAFSFVSAAFRLTSTLGFGYSAFRSSFSDFPRLASRWLLRYLRFRFRFSGSPFRSPWFPMKSFRFVCTRLPVCFLSSFPASLPQLFHWCFPFRFPLRDQRLTSAPFRSLPF